MPRGSGFGLVVILLTANMMAQQSAPAAGSPTSKSDTTAIPDTPKPQETHRFWDRKNILLFSGIALFRGLDYASTRNFQARGREEILLPDEVVNNSAGFAALEASATGVSDR